VVHLSRKRESLKGVSWQGGVRIRKKKSKIGGVGRESGGCEEKGGGLFNGGHVQEQLERGKL